MTPTSPLAGVLTGLLGGLIITLVVVSIIWVMSRRRRAAAALDGAESPTADQARPEDGDAVDGRKAA